MLIFLLMAGLGFAAAILMEQIDEQVTEEDCAQEQDDHPKTGHGSPLGDPSTDHEQVEDQANPSSHETASKYHHAAMDDNLGSDTLHDIFMQHEPGNLSFAVEDHQANHSLGGIGKDALYLGSDDVGTGGVGADQFHLSWDVEHRQPAQHKVYVELTIHHADADIKPEETTVTTQSLKDGAGTEILINSQSMAHVVGATSLQPSDIGLIHA